MNSETIGVSMSHELYETICKLAEENSISKAAQVKILIKKGLEEQWTTTSPNSTESTSTDTQRRRTISHISRGRGRGAR